MTMPVVETNAYKSQAGGILNARQRQAVITLLADDPFIGEEIDVGEFSLLSLLWEEKLNIRIIYIPPSAQDATIYLLAITIGEVEFQIKSAETKGGILRQLGVGISVRLIVELLLKAMEKGKDWFG